jgi:hypothetical protein
MLNVSPGGASNYCEASPNSVGYGTRIDSTGSFSVSMNSFSLVVRCAPPSATGLLFYGSAANDVPFGNGHRCVANPVFRLGPPVTVNATGHASRFVDFTQFPANTGGGAITAGSTKHFQFWYRNVAGGGSLFNLSDGLRATFAP